MDPSEPPLIQRFKSWLEPAPSAEDTARELFFTNGLVVLDTNILLSLYEYTESAREDVFTALEAVSDRLWMPHQVGLEFVRGRRSTLESRKVALTGAAKDVNRHLTQAVASVIAARNVVISQLAKYGAALDVGEELALLISDSSVSNLLQENRALLKKHLDGLKSQHGLPTNLAEANDPVLLRVAHMYGDRIGAQPDDSVLRARIEEAVGFRFPNEIPPGYRDFGKDTPVKAAGDFLLWEEVVEHAKSLPSGSRILFVSNDTKEDWYETRKGSGGAQRPWPRLFEEVRTRAGAELRIETPSLFYARHQAVPAHGSGRDHVRRDRAGLFSTGSSRRRGKGDRPRHRAQRGPLGASPRPRYRSVPVHRTRHDGDTDRSGVGGAVVPHLPVVDHRCHGAVGAAGCSSGRVHDRYCCRSTRGRAPARLVGTCDGVQAGRMGSPGFLLDRLLVHSAAERGTEVRPRSASKPCRAAGRGEPIGL
ncbi:PIN-like domain-containing protein [Streptomyces sp. NPDC001665]